MIKNRSHLRIFHSFKFFSPTQLNREEENSAEMGKEQECVNLFFFENGVPCNPKKVTKMRCELSSLIKRGSKGYTYCGKVLYTLCGELVCKFCPMELPCDSGYVLVDGCDQFCCRDYESAFQKELGGGCPKPCCPLPKPKCGC